MTSDNVTLLLVDDKPANLIALDALLSSDERLLITAHSAKEALDILSEEKIDLILLDVQMPDMNGFELAKALKERDDTAEIPIIFASAERLDQASLLEGFEQGAVDYLLKPLDPEITRAKVAVLLKVQRQKKQINELNAALARNISQLEAANRELESFSYSVSHDLRAPLRAVFGNAQAMEEDCQDVLNDEARRYLKKIRDNALRMDGLINDLLAFSRIGKKEVRKSSIDMTALVKQVFAEVSQQQQHRAEFVVGEMPEAWGDLSMVSIVWTNLISNAIKYSSKKPNPVIETGGRREGGEVSYYIKDNGAGFDMAYANKLFGTFQRLHDATEFEGVGIGLAIVQRIVTKHGGTIRAEAVPEEGATFFFSLPDESSR